jgi:hypothetical protein
MKGYRTISFVVVLSFDEFGGGRRGSVPKHNPKYG